MRASPRDWVTRNPWRAALFFGVILFLGLAALRILILDQDPGSAVARASVVAALFAALSGFIQSYEERRRADPSNSWLRLLLSVGTFVLVVLWRFPYTGEDEEPPHFFNVFGQEISTHDERIAILSAFAAGVLVWFVIGLIPRGKGEDDS